MLKVGDMILYRNYKKRQKEEGRIKSIAKDGKHVFAVFNCNRDWDNYRDYTAQRVVIKDIIKIGNPDKDLLPIPGG